MNNEIILNQAVTHIKAILSDCMQITFETPVLIVADHDSSLATLLTQAYQQAIPHANVMMFHEHTPDAIITAFNKLPYASLVILIQTTSFRLNAFRIRVELFNQGLKVIEHPHLARMIGNEMIYYIDSLAYDAEYIRPLGRSLKEKIDHATSACLKSDAHALLFSSRFESAKLNIGDYTEMKNVGGQFPIGEVFTEACDLEAVSGRVQIHAFGDTTFSVHPLTKPITLIIEKGRVIATENSISEFDQVLENIKADEGEVWVRELGFGLNRAFTREKTVTDIGTYERMCGVHLSLGAKHSMYKKPQFTRSTAKHHVDVFVMTDEVWLDNYLVFQHNQWIR